MLPTKLTYEYQKEPVKAHLKSLQQSDRRLRFGVVLTDEAIDNYVDQSWNKPGAWFGTFDGIQLIALVHVAVDDREAELGLSVDPHYRDRKLGQKLFERAVFYIKSRNIKHVYMHCLSENAAMKHLAHKYGMTTISEYGETDARATIDFPFTPLDSLTEAVAQQLALYDNNIRAFAKVWNDYIERIWDTLPKQTMKKAVNE